MKLLLIRHAQSTNNHAANAADYLQVRQADPPLTQLGQEQAHTLAQWMKNDPLSQQITHLYSSLTTRALQTAAPLAAALKLSVHGLSEAYECGGLNTGPEGNFQPVMGGNHASLVQDCPPLLWPPHLRGQAWDGGCEPWEHTRFAARAKSVVAQLQATEAANVLALVTHHDFAQFLLAELLALPTPTGTGLTFRISNTSTSLIEIQGGQDKEKTRVLHWLNRTDHLTGAATL